MQQRALKDIPKAELHVHIEGTVTPDMARRKAAEHGLTLPQSLFTEDGNGYAYDGFVDLVTRVYDGVADTIRSRKDFEDITYDYLKRSAAEGVIYVEFIMSPDHCERHNLPYAQMLAGMAEAMDRARTDFEIEARMNAALVRHLPEDAIARTARLIVDNPHAYVTGIDLAGVELEGDVLKYQSHFDYIAAKAPHLNIRLHAGENAGPVNMRDALLLDPKRIGHGVRVIEDEALVAEYARRGIVFEVCPTSNVLAGIYEDYSSHPLKQMVGAGLRVTLNSDDPGLFGCTIGGEYAVARDRFGFDDAALTQFTRTAIEAAFVDEPTRARLLHRLDAAMA